MTYSRPQTSTVNAFNAPARPNEPVAAPRQVVTTGPSGSLRVVDLGNGGPSSAAQLKGFFDHILDVTPKLIEPASIQQANQQVGALLDNVDMQGALRKGDQAALGMVKRLSPRAQDQLHSGMAAIGAQDYVESFARNAAIEPLLLNPKGEQEGEDQYVERMAQGRANVREKAIKESGVMNLPSEYRGEQGLKAQQGEALVMNGVRKNLDEQYNQYWNAKQSEQYGSESLLLSRARTLILSSPDAELGRDELIAQNQYANQFYESIKDRATPKQAAEMMFAGIRQTYEKLISEERFQEALAYLAFQEASAQQKIDTPAGGNLYDIPVAKDGSSLKSAIVQLQGGMRPQIERQKAQENYMAVQPLLSGLMRNDPESWQTFDRVLPTLASSPEQLSQLLAIRGNMTQISKEASPAQEQRMLEVKLALAKENADVSKINQSVAADTLLTPQQKLSLIADERAPKDPVMGSVARAREYNAPQIQGTTVALVEAQAKRDPAITKNPAALQEAVKKISNYVIVTATQNTETALQRLAEAGKPVTPDVANTVFRNELEAVRTAEIKKLGDPAPQRPTVQQERITELNYVQQQLRKNGGRVTLSVFPPTVVDAAKRNGIPTNDTREMTKFYFKRLEGTVESDGKTKVFPDPGKIWRDMIKKSKPGQNGQQSSNLSPPVEKMVSVIQRFVFGGDTTPAATPEKRGGAGSQPGGVLQLSKKLGEGLLGGALNVIAPPAMATNKQPAHLQNADQMPRLAAAFKNANKERMPMSLRDGPLPQIAALAPIRPLPLAIASDMHPWFVAIGINEGTRTANGGYTKNYFGHIDPGDGNRNVGTVSGGGSRGGGGSPQVIDRIWAGKLTNQAMAAAPVLMSNGVSRDTVGFHRIMFNYLDLYVQAPAAAGSFMQKLPQIMKGGLTIEAIAKARADSFYYPDGRWGGVWPYPRMLQDQRSRAGSFDYKKRL